MRIRIDLFRKYEDFEQVLPDDSIILLSGSSGSGKSTLFEAVHWLLFGKTQLISNFEKGSHHGCRVVLEYNGYTIIRKTKSKLLSIEYKEDGIEKTLIDDQAQGLINKLFGDRFMFQLTSYIPQDSYCPLLITNNKERLSYLHRLSFSDEDDPLVFIKQIKGKLKSFQTIYEDSLKEYKFNRSTFEEQLRELPPEIDIESIVKNWVPLNSLEKDITESQNTNTVEHKIISIRGHINELEENIEKEIKKEAELKYRQLQVEELRKKYGERLKNYEAILVDRQFETELPRLEKRLKDIQSAITERKHLQSTISLNNTQLHSIDESLKSIDKIELELVVRGQKFDRNIPIFTEVDLHRLNESIERYEQAMNICKRYKIAYDRSMIERALKEAEMIAALKPKLGHYNSYKQLISEVVNEGLEQEVREVGLELEEQRRRVKLLKCPHCRKGVYYKDNMLQRSDAEERPTAETITELEKRFSQLSMKLKIQNERSNQIKILKEFLGPSFELLLKYSSEIIELYTVCFKELSSIGYIEKPNIDLIEGHKRMNNSKLIIEYDKLRGHYDQLINHRDGWLTARNRLQDSINSSKLRLTELEILTHNECVSDVSTEEEVRERIRYWKGMEDSAKLKESISFVCKELRSEIENLQKVISEMILDPSLRDRHRSLLEKERILIESKEVEKRWRKVRELRVALEKQYVNIESDRKKLIALKELYRNASLVQCNGLETIARGINESLEGIMGGLFDKSLTIRLELYKKIKSNNRIKPIVNLNMRYNGIEVDRIDMLSKGELKRVSLAFIIAINELTHNPLIMLDELMAYLDADSLEDSIVALRTRLGKHGKTILCASHRDSEGNYDHTVRLN